MAAIATVIRKPTRNERLENALARKLAAVSGCGVAAGGHRATLRRGSTSA